MGAHQPHPLRAPARTDFSKDTESCSGSDLYLIIKRRTYRRHEQSCRITSIRKTLYALARAYGPTLFDVWLVSARCSYDESCTGWFETIRLDYDDRRDLLHVKTLGETERVVRRGRIAEGLQAARAAQGRMPKARRSRMLGERTRAGAAGLTRIDFGDLHHDGGVVMGCVGDKRTAAYNYCLAD
jgi:hypothetical protein